MKADSGSSVKTMLRHVPGVPLAVRALRKALFKGRLHGPAGIEVAGHRTYVGGLWHEMGRLQFNFLLEQGLRPHHVLLDIACGSLRAGTLLVPYLDEGHYLGIDKEQELIDRGLAEEIGPVLAQIKKPELVVSGDFGFDRFSRRPDFAIAQSLFSHLPRELIASCLRNLRAVAEDHTVFYTTFYESESRVENRQVADDHQSWFYTRGEMAELGNETGWRMEYIGNWNHPRGQVMTAYRPQ